MSRLPDSRHEARQVLAKAFQAVQTECLSLYQEMKTALGDEYFVEYDIIAPVLVKALRTGKNEEIRLAAARFLNRCGSPGLSELTPDLLGAAQDELPDIRLAALSCLDSFSLKGQEAAIPVLKGAMKDTDARIRLAAVRQWKGLGLDLASEGITTLGDLLTDQDVAVRREVLSVLAWLAADAGTALSAVIEVLLTDQEESVRQDAARALLAIDPEFVKVIAEMATVMDKADRENVLMTLRLVGSRATQQRRKLQKSWNSPVADQNSATPDQRSTTLPGASGNADAEPDWKNTFRRDGRTWTLSYQGKTVPKPHSVGLFYIRQLLDNPNKPFTATELRRYYTAWKVNSNNPLRRRTIEATVAASGKSGDEDSNDKLSSAGHDLGDELDEVALESYKQRREQLTAQIADLRSQGKTAQADECEADKRFIEGTLQAARHKGRPKKMSEAAKKNRDAVRIAIHRTMDDLQEAHPPLYQHLRRSLEIGDLCCYAPEIPTAWNE